LDIQYNGSSKLSILLNYEKFLSEPSEINQRLQVTEQPNTFGASHSHLPDWCRRMATATRNIAC